MKKGCRNCKYAEWELTEKGNIRRSVSGTCHYKVTPPVLPDSVGRWDDWAYRTAGIWVDGGKNCPCFEAKK